MRGKNSQPRVPRPKGAKAGKSHDDRDSTERKQAETALDRSSGRSWQTLDSMMEGCMVIGLDWTYLYVNDVAARQALQKRENLIGRTMLEMYPGVEQSDVFARYRRTMQERINQRFEQFYTFADGTTKWYSFSVEPVPEGIFVLTLETTEQKKAELALRQARDTLEARVAERTRELDDANERVTGELAERKQAEERLRRDEATLRGILDATQESIWLFSADGVVLSANPMALKRFRKTSTEVIGRHMTDILPADLAASRLAKLKEVVESGQPLEFEDERAGLQFRHSFYPVPDAEKRVTAVVSFSRDITEHKQAEASLRESEVRYRALFEQSPVAVAYAREGRTLYVNHAYLRMFGFSDVGELRGRPLTEQIAPSRRAEITERARVRAQGASVPIAYETVGLRKDNTEFPFFVEISQVILADGPATIAFFTDITERKRTETEIQQRVAELRTSNKELERFNRLAVDRELRMVELKKEVNDLLRKVGQPIRYAAETEKEE